MSDFNFTCAWCNKPIEQRQTILELRNGPYRDSRGEVDFGNSESSYLHAGSGETADEPECLEPAGVKALFMDVGILLNLE